MRAIEAVAFGEPEVLELRHPRTPVPEAGQVLIEVAIAPVLFLDTQIRAGLAREWFTIRPPYVPGSGVAGTIGSIGADIDSDRVGDRVVVDTPERGGYLERALVPVDRLIAVPDGVDLHTAAALLHDGRTALALMEATDPRPDEWVLIVGAAGGLGVLLVQLARSVGARVLAAARGGSKLALAGRLGADAVVDYSEPGWAEKVSKLTGGRGADVVFDGVGGEIGVRAFEVTAPGGRFSAHGTPGGGFAQVDPDRATRRGVTVLGIDQVQLDPASVTRLTGLALSRAADGDLTPVVGQTFALERAADAHRAIGSRTAIGKTLLEV